MTQRGLIVSLSVMVFCFGLTWVVSLELDIASGYYLLYVCMSYLPM